ncbi:hypothetical protein PybrP1_008048 [[Pythium] brassicae (nom. inval.)]|nr:hypothetical protein PybrP1_008048 [[Pythium] brassicae (nom. inval.)]
MESAVASGLLVIVKFLHENRTEGCSVRAMDGAVEFVRWKTCGSCTRIETKAALRALERTPTNTMASWSFSACTGTSVVSVMRPSDCDDQCCRGWPSGCRLGFQQISEATADVTLKATTQRWNSKVTFAGTNNTTRRIAEHSMSNRIGPRLSTWLSVLSTNAPESCSANKQRRSWNDIDKQINHNGFRVKIYFLLP